MGLKGPVTRASLHHMITLSLGHWTSGREKEPLTWKGNFSSHQEEVGYGAMRRTRKNMFDTQITTGASLDFLGLTVQWTLLPANI